MADLKTNYVDDKLDASKNQLRKYQQIQNDDGTVSFIDVTEYKTTGTSFGALDVNNTNKAVNQLNADLSDLNLKLDGKLDNDYNDNANIGKGIKFDKNADGSYFTFRPYRPNNIMQVTKNDKTGLLTIDSDGKITSLEGKIVSTGSLANELVNISPQYRLIHLKQ